MTPDLHDITSPEAFLSADAPWWQSAWFWVLVVAGGVILSLVVRRLYKRDAEEQRRQKLLEHATEELNALKAEVDSLSPQVSAVRISLIMRQFLEDAFKDKHTRGVILRMTGMASW